MFKSLIDGYPTSRERWHESKRLRSENACLYAFKTKNGKVKVGYSESPFYRINEFHLKLIKKGDLIQEMFCAKCVGKAYDAETVLIAYCAELAEKRVSSEWFEGICFESIKHKIIEISQDDQGKQAEASFWRRYEMFRKTRENTYSPPAPSA